MQDTNTATGGNDDKVAAQPPMQPPPQRTPEPAPVQGETTPMQPPLRQTPEPAPVRGETAWGRWSNAGSLVSLELDLEALGLDGVRAKALSVEVAEGWLCVQRATDEGKGPPVLFGRFAQTMEEDDLVWGVEEGADGRRVVCIEVPKQPVVGGVGASVDCIFDESLCIQGESVVEPGLSQGTITLQLPKSCPS
jgi:hypothetical protein